MTKLNIRPYFDDYNEDKQFYQILFRPSFPIQGRELNQLQTILQEQIARHGRNIFKEGAMVIPGQLSVDNDVDYVKLDSSYNQTAINGYIDQFKSQEVDVIGLTSGVKAKVILVQHSETNQDATIWVKYISSGIDGLRKTFEAGETIQTTGSTPLFAKIQLGSSSIGKGSTANIQRGVYFVNSRFVLVQEQTIVLDAYSNSPSYRVGLQIVEDFISPEEDSSLYDNAQGSPNFAAPGAHRYFIDLVLKKYSIDDSSDKAFIELVRVKNGTIESKVSRTEYSIIEDSMARRTYDESGNYSLSPFASIVKEHRNNDRGSWQANTLYESGDIFTTSTQAYVVEVGGISGLTEPTNAIGTALNGSMTVRAEKTPSYNQGSFTKENGGDYSKLAVVVDPGKAYVLGYEISKIAPTTIAVEKASSFKSVRNATIQTNLGSYIIVDNVAGVLDVTKYPTVELRDRYTSTRGTAAGSVIGTARARYVEYDSGTVGSTSCRYVLSLFDIKMNSGKKFSANVRQIAFTNGSGLNFTADASKDSRILTGSINGTSGTTTLNGVGTKFTTEVSVGDAIGYYSTGTLIAPIVVASIQSDTSLTTASNLPSTLTNATGYNVFTTFYSNDDSLIYKLPTKYTRSVKDIDDAGTTNISYYVKQFYSGVVSSGNLIVSTASSAETFASPQQPDAYHIVANTSGDVIAASITLNSSSNVATIAVGSGYNGQTVSVIATIKKTSKERVKTIVRGFSEDFTSQSAAQSRLINLSKVDGIRLIKVEEFVDGTGTPVSFGSAIPVGSTAIDITDRYVFSNGAQDSFYDFCAVSNKTLTLPNSPIRVYYDYHEHSSVGDYFTIDSYQKLESESHTNKKNESLNLFDCIDFRPTKTASGFSSSLIPAIGFDVIADYSYFLPRIDKIALNATGEFVRTIGAPSDNPVEPSNPENSMLLFTMTISPSVIGTPAVSIKKEDNKRYTMKDIGSLDRRLSNVEYYTALSLLENQTNNLQLFDSVGNLQFKNGFIVDSLTDQKIADTDSAEFKSSIDVLEGKLRPSYFAEAINFIETVVSDADRKAAGYALNNGIATLPFTSSALISQPFGTTTESVTPYIQLNFIGNVALNPSSDEWYESKYRPDIVINQEGNFNAVVNQYKAELGTVWNQWQTAWTGVSTSIVDIDRGDRSEQTAITTVVQGQSRSGVLSYVKAVYDTKVLSDRIISVDIIPFVRSRIVSFFASGLKPETKMNAFFDDVSVNAYVNGASKFTLTNKVGTFDYTTSAGANSNQTARTASAKQNAAVTAFATGDVVHNGLNGNIAVATATGVVVIDDDSKIHVVNIRGSFTVGQSIYGTISGASATLSAIEAPSMITNSYGELAGVFEIPSNEKIRFRTGNRNFVLSDSATNGKDFTTKAIGIYSANGFTENRERTILSTRNGEFAKETVSENRQIVSTTSNVLSTTYYDPLAQSFATPDGNGIFVESIDVYFYSKDRSLPVSIEIREMVNGSPTTNVVPGSRVTLKPSKVNASSNGAGLTKFKMNFPIYLDGGTEYCFVLASDSPYYRVWVSQLGQDDVITGQRIAKQPYLGTIFKSQNASTWSADQLQDIKFTINRCVFDTSVAANIKFSNDALSMTEIEKNAFYTKSGQSKVRVRIPNHGIQVGSSVRFAGIPESINGISNSTLNASFTVLWKDTDHLVFDSGVAATATGFSKMSTSAWASRFIQADVANLVASQIQFAGTSVKHFIRGISKSYAMPSSPIELIPYENNFFDSTLMIADTANETSFNSGKKSVELIAQLQSDSNFLSPVLDTTRYSLICVSNRINENTETEMNVSEFDVTSRSVNSVTFSATGFSAGTTGDLAFLKIGQVIRITGAVAGNNKTVTVTSIDSTGTAVTTSPAAFTVETKNITIATSDRYFSEISESGTSEAKYIMKPLRLSSAAIGLKVYFDVNIAPNASFDLYYRVASNGNSLAGSWTKATASRGVNYNTSRDQYDGMEYTISSSVPFDSAQIKIVMNSIDSARVPTFRQIRMIATT